MTHASLLPSGRRRLRHASWASLAAGVVAALGFAPLQWWPATLIGLALWLLLVHAAPTLRSALWRSWLWGVGHFTLGNNWIQHAFDFQDRMPPALGYFAVVGLSLYLAVFPMLAGGLAWRIARRERLDAAYVATAAAAWIGTEWLRATLFTGYAWNPIGVTWVPTSLAPLAAWIGSYALSGVTVAIAGAILLVAGGQRRTGGAVLGAAALAALAGALLTPVPAQVQNARVRVVQPNIGQDQLGTDDYAERAFRTMLALSGRPGPAPRLVVWPEGTVNHYLEDGYPLAWYDAAPAVTRGRIARVLGPRDVALVGGSALFFEGDDLRDAGNSVFAVNDRAQLLGRYDKAHLVPYGEYLPMRGLLAPLGLSRLVMGDIDYRPGPGPRSLPLPAFGKVGMQICYEIIFSGKVIDRANRPALLFNPSNDAWFGSWGPPQHLAQARLRAIEEGLPILRSTPTGISAVIDARGNLVAQLPLGTRGAIEVAMPAPLPPTLFAKVGNWMALIVAAVLLAAAVALRRTSR